ncbi:MAG TPA: glycosyltransferase [Puia sp.]|nr:glycosyltransferase [Puia sp.]
MSTVISLVSYPFLPARVGGQKGVALFNKYFSRNLRLICVTTRANDPAAAEGYEVINILSNSPLRYINIFYFFTIRKLIKKEKAEYLLLEHPYYGWLGILLKWFCPVKLVVHSHNIEGLRWKTLGKWWWKILWAYEKWTHRAANFNFFIHDDDREYAIQQFGLDPTRCITMSYGIEWNSPPSVEKTETARNSIRKSFDLESSTAILFFNGAFNYSPNLEALKMIIEKINPILQEDPGFDYRIIVCGRDIPAEISERSFPGISFAGFVDDIGEYFMAANVFINPITEGGGIKTKLVEALGYNSNAVSTLSGATGINPTWCNGKLLICENGNWKQFAKLIKEAVQINSVISDTYYNYFYWGNSTRRAAEAMEKI